MGRVKKGGDERIPQMRMRVFFRWRLLDELGDMVVECVILRHFRRAGSRHFIQNAIIISDLYVGTIPASSQKRRVSDVYKGRR